MEVKTSLLDNMIGVGDMVLLEPLTEDSFIENLRNRFDHNEIYVSPCILRDMSLMCLMVSKTKLKSVETFTLPSGISPSLPSIPNVKMGTFEPPLRKHPCTFCFSHHHFLHKIYTQGNDAGSNGATTPTEQPSIQ